MWWATITLVQSYRLYLHFCLYKLCAWNLLIFFLLWQPQWRCIEQRYLFSSFYLFTIKTLKDRQNCLLALMPCFCYGRVATRRSRLVVVHCSSTPGPYFSVDKDICKWCALHRGWKLRCTQQASVLPTVEHTCVLLRDLVEMCKVILHWPAWTRAQKMAVFDCN